MKLKKDHLIEVLVEFIRTVVTRLPDDVYASISKAMQEEDDPVSRRFYEIMWENIHHASRNGIPLCQDTGIPIFFIRLGTRSPYIDEIPHALREAVSEATKRIPLRPNAVDPITDENTGDNVGRYIPWIEYELLPGERVTEISLIMSGGGSSLPSRSITFKPLNGFEEMIKLVVDTLAEYGMNACPPLFIGLGIGATMEIAALLSKRALLRRIGSRNPNEAVARMEETLLRELNRLRVGIQGYGVGRSVLDVHIEYSMRHPTTFAVGLSMSCWALRRGVLKLYPSGGLELPYHKEVELIHGA